MKKITAKYPDTERSLYAIARGVRSRLKADLGRFAKHDKKYTKGFVEKLATRIDTVMALPGHAQRKERLRELRSRVIAASKDCCSDFMKLLLYVNEDGFAKQNIAALRRAAGCQYYKRATEKNWLAMSTLNGMMTNFLGGFAEGLEKAHLPPEFAGKVADHVAAFEKAFIAFHSYKFASERETAEKLAANNELYLAVLEILKDGKRIFKRDAEKLRQYSYRHLLIEWKLKRKGRKKGVVPNGLPLVLTAEVLVVPEETVPLADDVGLGMSG